MNTRANRLGIEPAAVSAFWTDREDDPDLRQEDAFESEIELSKAISLKRIADAVDEIVRGEGYIRTRQA